MPWTANNISTKILQYFRDVFRPVGNRERAIKEHFDSISSKIESDADRAINLIEEWYFKLGEEPIAVDAEGNVFVHPLFQEELKKPENNELVDLLTFKQRLKSGDL